MRPIARLPLFSCGIDIVTTAQSKRRRWHGLTLYMGVNIFKLPYKACAWTADVICKWMEHGIHIGMFQCLCSQIKLGSDGTGVRWRRDASAVGGWGRRFRANARGWLPNALQSRRYAYPMGMIDGGFLSRVVSELALITLGRGKFTCVTFPGVILACHIIIFSVFERVSIWRGVLLIDHQEPTPPFTARGTMGPAPRPHPTSLGRRGVPVSAVAIRPMSPSDLIHVLGDSIGLMYQHGSASRRCLRWSSPQERPGWRYGLSGNSQQGLWVSLSIAP